ncbi:GntR family transcriptional regulator [Spiractinospora alimapuensis]|uniref:GntR family transcriptional regulator n=1 Tax=Spiractinospora alimapuensis TaxID=2820884 RepID=UPI001F3C922F|nr:GntR family transcriptional regulator [Spiractinospora alimapuensis]QVQ53711.1 GntR family transcriptional regulator [Spiractinospora alimapuensis]
MVNPRREEASPQVSWLADVGVTADSASRGTGVVVELARLGERRTAYQFVRDTISQAILTGRLQAGDRLIQAEVAKKLRVSTTPVREALRDLAAEGLVRVDAHRGAVVRALNAEEAEEIYRVRCLLEPEIMRRAVVRITDDDIQRAQEIQDLAEAEVDLTRWVERNRQFHAVFTEAAHSPRLAAIVESLQSSAAVYILADMMQGGRDTRQANQQHREILATVRERDAEAAAAAILRHIHHTPDGVADVAAVGRTPS